MESRSILGGIAIALGLWISCGQVWAGSRSDELFAKLLGTPDDFELNVQFAREAESQGQLRLALAALERAVAARPDDRVAWAEFSRIRRKMLPPRTLATVETGVSYSSNSRQLPASASHRPDGVGDIAVTVTDERPLVDTIMRTTFSVGGQWQRYTDALDSGRVSISSGPVYLLANGLWFHVAPGAAQLWLDGRRLYDEVRGGVTVGGQLDGLTQTVTGSLGWRRGNDGLLYSDSTVVDIEGRFVARAHLFDGDLVYLQPRLHLSHAIDPFPQTEITLTVLGQETSISRDLSPLSYEEWGGRIAYYVPTFNGAVYLGAGLSVFERTYDSFVLDPDALSSGVAIATGEKRRDLYIEPTAHIVFPRLIAPNLDLRFDYKFEDNHSNDQFREFHNHVAGLRIVGSF